MWTHTPQPLICQTLQMDQPYRGRWEGPPFSTERSASPHKGVEEGARNAHCWVNHPCLHICLLSDKIEFTVLIQDISVQKRGDYFFGCRRMPVTIFLTGDRPSTSSAKLASWPVNHLVP